MPSGQNAEIPVLRIPIDRRPITGLGHPNSIMVDKLTTMPSSKLREHIGQVPDTDMLALS